MSSIPTTTLLRQGVQGIKMAKPRVLFFNAVQQAHSEYTSLGTVASTEVVTSKSRKEFFHDVRHKYKDISVIYRTSSSGAVAGRFDDEFVKNLPETLKIICHTGAGYDQIDVKACSDRGITVTHAPDAVTNSTADLAMFLILGAIRQLNPSLMSLRRGQFKKGLSFGHDVAGKTLGILGLGRIGRAVQRRAEPYGMKFLYHNRTRQPNDIGMEYVSFDRLLSESDIISIHVPLRENTRHLIGAEQLQKMKDGVVIVNTSRGAVIDEAALTAALDDGKVGAVGLDVYENEPAIHPSLASNQRALLVPHMGTHTFETMAGMEATAIENVRRAVTGESLLHVVPEQASGFQ